MIRYTEGYLWSQGAFENLVRAQDEAPPIAPSTAIGRAAGLLSRDLLVRAIIVMSRSGTSVRMMSAARPAAPIVALVGDEATARRLALPWGVIPVRSSPEAMATPEAAGRAVALELGLASEGQTVLVAQGYNDDPALSVPRLSIVTV